MTRKCLDYPQKIQRKIQKAIGTQKVEAKGSLEVIPFYQKKTQRKQIKVIINDQGERRKQKK